MKIPPPPEGMTYLGTGDLILPKGIVAFAGAYLDENEEWITSNRIGIKIFSKHHVCSWSKKMIPLKGAVYTSSSFSELMTEIGENPTKEFGYRPNRHSLAVHHGMICSIDVTHQKFYFRHRPEAISAEKIYILPKEAL